MAGLDFILDLAVVALIAGVSGIICRAMRLSVVVGYLVAGIIIGPYTPPFELVHDADRIQMLADLGMVFLIFGIGLGFSLRRMQRLGVSLFLATALGAVFVLLFSRAVAAALGFSDQQGLFIAGVLMVSSSAIIAKILEEIRANHTRWGQMALGVTLLEDIVSIAMLTLLSSMVQLGGSGGEGASLWHVLASFLGFVSVFSVLVLLVIPRLLRWLDIKAVAELRVLVVAGLLLGMGWVSVRMGYSMALTAFIFGAIIGSTPQHAEIDRLFEGMRHLFGAVFFVAMGMMFDVSLLDQFWPGLLALTAAAFVLRMPALAGGLLLVGTDTRNAIKSALTLTPLGEFSFVIAFLGLQSGVMPAAFYPAAVGASLLTCLISPVLVHRAEPIGLGLERAMPGVLTRAIGVWHGWLERLQHARARSFAWKIVAPRIVQTFVHLLIVSGFLALVSPAYSVARRVVGPNLLFPGGTMILLLTGVGLVLLPPVIAIWRNITALAMIVAEATTQSAGSRQVLRPLIQRAFASASLAFAFLWVFALLPTDLLPMQLLAGILVVMIIVTLVLWRQMIRWQSRFEHHLREELTAASTDHTDAGRSWGVAVLDKGRDWNLHIEEFDVPMDSDHAGKRILDLQLRTMWGSSIVGIDRQGYAINNPSRNDRIFPDDKLLLLGTTDALERSVAFLSQRAHKPAWIDQFENLTTEALTVPAGTSWSDQSLEELNLVSRFGVQIAGIRRGGGEIVSPGAREVLREGDELLVVGTHENIRAFGEELARSVP